MILTEGIKARLAIALGLIAVTIFSASCGFIEPNPAVNSSAHPPASGTVAGYVSNYVNNQQVDGIINPTFVPAVNDTSVTKVTLTVDSQFVEAVTRPPYTFAFNTNGLPDGKHLFVFGVQEKGDTLGLLQLPEAPATVVYSIVLDFERTPPTAPTNVGVSYENEHFRVSWTPVSDGNFAYYDIIKRYYDSEHIKRQAEFKVYQRTPGTFLDTTESISLPDSAEYQVGASNNVTTAYAPDFATEVGTSLSLGTASVLAQDVNGQVIFNIGGSHLISVSTTAPTAQAVSGYLGTTAASGKGVLNPDKSELYVKDKSDYGISVVDTKTLQTVSSIRSFSPHDVFAVGPNNLIYFASNSTLTVYNAATDSIMKTYTLFSTQAVSLNLSPAGDALIAVDFSGIKLFSVAGDSVNLTASYSWTTAAAWWTPNFISVDWNSSRIYAALDGAKNVAVLDAKTLKFISNLSTPEPPTPYNTSPPPQYDGIGDLAVNANNVYVAYLVENPYQYNGTLLVEYDQASMQQKRIWLFTGENTPGLGLSANGSYLFLCDGSDQWIVDIGGAAQ